MEAVAESPTPVTTTTDVSSAAPATQETSVPSSTTSQRPRSFTEAFEQVAAAQEKTAPPTEPAATAPGATPKPDGGNPKDSTGQAKGAPPEDKWPVILENARAKERERIESEIGWARHVPRETLQEFAGIAQRMTRDPIAFLQEFTAELQAHPTYGPQLRSYAGRTLASGRGQPAVDLTPDLVVDDGNGRQIQTFSADRVQQIVQHAVDHAIAKEVIPLKTESKQRKDAADAAALKQSIYSAADATMVDIHDILEISDPKAETSQKLFGAVNELMARDPTLTPEKAARQVWKTHIRPTLESQASKKTLDQLQQKAAGNTANGLSATATPKRPTNAKELAAWMRAQAGGR